MEFLLLWADDLDDAIGALRHLAPKIPGFLLATALFAGTSFALMYVPRAVPVVIGLILSASLIEAVRRRCTRAASGRDE